MASQDCEAAASTSGTEKEKEAEKDEGQITVRVTSSDGKEFEVDGAAARGSVMLRNMMALGIAGEGVALPEVRGDILAMAVKYLKGHRNDRGDGYSCGFGDSSSTADTALRKFDSELVGGLDQATLIDLLAAANYMDMEGLMKLTCRTVAEMFNGKTIPEIRQTFHIRNDYPADEEEEVRREISWALD